MPKARIKAAQAALPDLPPFAPQGLVAGLDEAGRGCLAGPVVSAACVLPERYDLPGLTDSKALSADRRHTLALAIRQQAVAWALGLAWPREIDRVNILQASLRSMERAAARLRVAPVLLLVDGNQRIDSPLPQHTVIGGDALCPAISAASILAKTWRDHLLCILDRLHPGYGLSIHKGYGTAMHQDALRRLGPSPIHRLSFRGVLPEQQQSATLLQEKQQCLPGICT
ncbi:RNase HII [Humidesulfovibrio mexicanus]|jgi:ribonuclease HII|uniref:Ribonuclease HII n=1 Tax=Humidesulfovibrio mexicanus TaxID=147047 RepID=A0A238ZVI4_9BACT|nr:ribonuclease HII [Humidesulfovibrio mexicanus]SNR87360.1 RNase HII [Humidesulfovibrio mexicanus]